MFMTVKDLMLKSDSELRELAVSCLRDALAGRIQKDSGSLRKPSELKLYRRLRARILTVINQRCT
ncbi:MAG: Ribosomal protein [Verrucomicrobiota bacterium]|jgi:ribosomal protein L29